MKALDDAKLAGGGRGRWIEALELAAVLAVGGVLRFRGLGYQSLWYDETQVRMLAYIPRAHLFEAFAPYENTPPPYFVFIQAWMKAFGRSEFSMRLPSAIFGIMSIALIYWLAKQVGRQGPRRRFIAMSAATLLAVSRFHIAYCQEARPYSMAFMLMLISCGAFVKLLHERGILWQMVYAAATISMFWTHPYTLWIFVAQCCFLVVFWICRRERDGASVGRLALLVVIVGITFLPWLESAHDLVHGSTIWMPRPTWKNIALPFLGSGIVCAASLALLALSVVYFMRAKNLRTVFVWMVASLPIAIPLLLSLGRYPFFVPRYGLWAIGGLYIAMAMGLAALPVRWSVLGLVAFVGMQCPALVSDFRHKLNMQVKADVRDAAGFIRHSAAPGDRYYCVSDLLGYTLDDYLRDSKIAVLRMPVDVLSLEQVKHIWVMDQGDADLMAAKRAAVLEPFRSTPFEIECEWQYPGLCLFELGRKNESTNSP
jgi:hypothetical protein